MPEHSADFSYSKSVLGSLTLYRRDMLSAKISAGLLARDSSLGHLPSLTTSGISPFVLAYSGGFRVGFSPTSLFSLSGTVIYIQFYIICAVANTSDC